MVIEVDRKHKGNHMQQGLQSRIKLRLLEDSVISNNEQCDTVAVSPNACDSGTCQHTGRRGSFYYFKSDMGALVQFWMELNHFATHVWS